MLLLRELLFASLATGEPLAFVDVTLVPMDGPEALPHRTVVTEGDRIVAIGPASGPDAPAVPEGALRIDGRGRWLLPGLIDNHIHLFDERDLPLYLAHGVTTVRNLKGNPWHLELRDELRRGERLGPRMVTAGPFVNEPHVATPEQAEATVRGQVELGYDCIKIHGPLSEATYERLIEVADELVVPVVGHVPRNLLLSTVLGIGGMAEISHAEELIDTHFDLLGRHGDLREIRPCVELVRAAGTRVTPTLACRSCLAPTR